MRIADKFEVLRILGRGAFGIVYEARDSFLERAVAIKTIRDDIFGSATAREKFEKRFMREARSVARLTHPNIIAVYEAGSHTEGMYLVMELVRGQTLREILAKRGALPLQEALAIARGLLDALDYAHAQGVVHRDIKPENLMVREDGVLKVADFGLAKVAEGDSGTLTQDGAVMGTPSYMPPEQVMSKAVDARSDLFSTAAVLYEALCGVRPFTADSIHGLLYQILSADPAPMSQHVKVPAHVDRAILRCLAKKPDERFQSGHEFLESLMGHESPVVVPLSPSDAQLNADLAAFERIAAPAPPAAPAVDAVPAEPQPLAGEPPGITYAVSPAPIKASESVSWLPGDDTTATETGSLAQMPVPELLLRLRRRRSTGLLVVTSPSFRMGIDIDGGLPVGASGGPAETSLGATLVKMGFLDEASLAKLVEQWRAEVASGRAITLGSLAVRTGMVGGSQILTALETQIDTRILALLAVAEGTYRFYEGSQTGEWRGMSPRPVEELIVKALKAYGTRRFQLVQGFVRRAWKRGLKAKPSAPEALSAFKLGARVQRFIETLDGRAAEEALAANVIPRADAELVLYLLWVSGALDIMPGTTASVPRAEVLAAANEPPPPPRKPKVEHLPQVIRKEPAPPPVQPRVEHLPRVVRSPTAPDSKAWELMQKAELALEKKDFQGAIDLLLLAHDRQPKVARTLYLLGWATFRRQPGHPAVRAEARRYLEQALEIDRLMVDAHVALGKIARVEGELQAARTHFQRALSYDYKNRDAQAELDALNNIPTPEKPRDRFPSA